MKVEGSHVFEAPRETVYEMLQNPEVLAKIIPGCEQLNRISDTEYNAALEISVGPVKGKFKGKVVLSEQNPFDSYTMAVNGQGMSGFVNGVGKVSLSDHENATTMMSYLGDAQIGGRIASVGQRLVDSAAKALIRQSLEGVDQYIKAYMDALAEAQAQPEPVAAAAVATSMTESATDPVEQPQPQTTVKVVMPEIKPPSQTEFAAGVVKGTLDDLIPKERRPLLIGAGIVLIAIVLLSRRNSSRRKKD